VVRIVEVLEVNGKKYVPLEDYQRLICELEKVQPHYTNAEILEAVGEDEVYNG
jgi:hypothetical protein